MNVQSNPVPIRAISDSLAAETRNPLAPGNAGLPAASRSTADPPDSPESIFSWETSHAVEPWPEPVNAAEILDALTAFLSRYVVLGNFGAHTLALWVLHTHAFRLRDVTTYIGLESPQKRCGKTTLLTVLSELVNRPVVASNISSPAFFRVIQEARPTLMIDEADTVLRRNDELRGILNSGYKRKTAYVVRVVSQRDNPKSDDAVAKFASPETAPECRPSAEDPYARTLPNSETSGTRLARFSSWCPKVIATIRHLPETLADRCIVIQMNRKKPDEPCARLKGLDGTELRRKCARFVSDHQREIASSDPPIPQDLHDRAGEIWEPLLVLADLAGGQWPELARQAAVGLTIGGHEEIAVGALLFDILFCFVQAGAERLFSRVLAAKLNDMGERPWNESNNEITEVWLAKQLRPYNVRPKNIWIGKHLAKGYLKADFAESAGRYLPKTQAKSLMDELAARVRPGAKKKVT
jgi:hypothetical protein